MRTSSSTSLPMRCPRTPVARVAALHEPRTTVGGVNLASGFQPELWAVASPDAAPPGVVGFNEPLIGPTGYVLPATQHDVVIWLTDSAYDAVFDLSRGIVTELAGRWRRRPTKWSAGRITTIAT